MQNLSFLIQLIDIYNQQKVKINKVQIFDAGHKLYLEESFNANK